MSVDKRKESIMKLRGDKDIGEKIKKVLRELADVAAGPRPTRKVTG